MISAITKVGLHGLHFLGFTLIYIIDNQIFKKYSARFLGLQCKPKKRAEGISISSVLSPFTTSRIYLSAFTLARMIESFCAGLSL